MSVTKDISRISTVYGPVDSRRYGRSLGVDLLLTDSTCSFRCAYCQLGSVNRATRERAVWVPTRQYVEDLVTSPWAAADVITFSGSGEPTLALNLGEALLETKRITDKPILVLTNGSLLGDPAVRHELLTADEVSCKLDATDEEWVRKINHPMTGITLAMILEGIRTFRSEYRGRLTIQSMILPANRDRTAQFAEIIRTIGPEEVHLHVPVRAIPKEWSVETRGDFQSRADSGAFRTIPAAELLEMERQLQEWTGVRVVSFPQHEH